MASRAFGAAKTFAPAAAFILGGGGTMATASIIIAAVDRASKVFRGVGAAADASGLSFLRFGAILQKVMLIGLIFKTVWGSVLVAVGAIVTIGAAAIAFEKFATSSKRAEFQLRIMGLTADDATAAIGRVERQLGRIGATSILSSGKAVNILANYGPDFTRSLLDLSDIVSDLTGKDPAAIFVALFDVIINSDASKLEALIGNLVVMDGLVGPNGNVKDAPALIRKIAEATSEISPSNWQDTASAWERLTNLISKSTGPIISLIAGMTAAGVNLGASFVMVATSIGVAVDTIIDSVVEVLRRSIEITWAMLSSFLSPGKIQELWDEWGAGNIWDFLFPSDLQERWSYWWGSLGFFSDILEDITQFGANINLEMAKFLTKLSNMSFEEVLLSVQNAINNVGLTIGGFFINAWESVKTAVSDFISWTRGRWRGFTGWLRDTLPRFNWSSVFQPIIDVFTSKIQWIKDTWRNFLDWLSSVKPKFDFNPFGGGFGFGTSSSATSTNVSPLTPAPAGKNISVTLMVGEDSLGTIAINAVTNEVKYRSGVVVGQLI